MKHGITLLIRYLHPLRDVLFVDAVMMRTKDSEGNGIWIRRVMFFFLSIGAVLSLLQITKKESATMRFLTSYRDLRNYERYHFR